MRYLLILALAFATNLGFAQSNLTNSEYGTEIQTYLDQKKESLSLVSSDIADLYVNKEFFSTKTKITHVYVNQRYQGIPVFNAISSVAIKDNVVFYYANNFIGHINDRVNTTTPRLTPEQAIQRVASELNLGSVQDLTLLETIEKKYVYSDGNISQENIPVELVYYNRDGELVLAWDLSIHTLDGNTWPSVRVDATNGEILNQNDWILTCNFGDGNHVAHTNHNNENVQSEATFTLFKSNPVVADGSQYNVFAFPTEAPSFGERTLLNSPADDIASPFGWQVTIGTSGEDYTITRGNNVWVQEDRGGNDTTNGYSPDGTDALNFDFPLDLNNEPIVYEDASLTNLFYVNNTMHDIWYQYGFDEASGNFQQDNYGNGGLGNDFVFAAGQDGGGLNNANFGTGPDGTNGFMQMYLWSAPVVQPVRELVTLNNGSLTGDVLAANPATGVDNNIPGATSTPVTADLVVVNDGTALPSEACSPLVGFDVAGKIALIRRGSCNFVVKIQNAQDAGAVGVIMINHNNPTNDPAYVQYVNMAGFTTPAFTIPSVFVNYEDGEAIIDAIVGGETINATLQDNSLVTPFQLDGSLDNGIVSHEYGHGISVRLTGGASQAGCLSTAVSATQMGEGWSDWFALMLTIKPGDSGDDARAMVTYALGQPTDGPGSPDRPFKYTTNMSENPLTYGVTNNPALSQPHGIGSVWATILWDLTWAYVEKYGYDEDLINGTGGNNKVMQLVIDGLKLQPCNPGFVQGRDAILAADTALTGGEDQCLIWEVFANRGLGLNANQGLLNSRLDQTEDFSMPLDTDPTLANCTSLSVEEFNKRDYKVYPNPTNGNVFIKTNRNLGDVRITLTDLNGRQVHSIQTELFDKVEVNMSQLQSGIYILNIDGQNINSNNKIIKN